MQVCTRYPGVTVSLRKGRYEGSMGECKDRETIALRCRQLSSDTRNTIKTTNVGASLEQRFAWSRLFVQLQLYQDKNCNKGQTCFSTSFGWFSREITQFNSAVMPLC